MEFYTFDASYLERLMARDPVTERHFYGYFGDLLRIKLRARKFGRQAIDDICQETFLRMWQALRRETIREPERIGAFVNTICNHVILEHGRADARYSNPEDGLPDIADAHADSEGQVARSEERGLVHTILGQMPDRNRELLSAVFLEERTSADICREMGVDPNYLRVLLFRARAQFREMLERRRPGKPS